MAVVMQEHQVKIIFFLSNTVSCPGRGCMVSAFFMKQRIIHSTLIAIGVFSILANTCYKSNYKHANGINFYTGSWEEALQKSKAENKLIFLYISATWCGPCRRLKAYTFSDSTVAMKFNQNFINLNVDETNPQSIELCKTYRVEEYPTLLFIRPNETVAERLIGYRDAKQLLKEIQKIN